VGDGDPLFFIQTELLAALSARYKVPAMHYLRNFVDAGGLMSYGPSVADAHRIAGDYAGRILKGEKPADLPVQRSTRIEMVLNLKTAKALGIDVPTATLLRATEVIE
jgi:putative tryptophan/tyrosine transport system substrate-binding protein